MEGLPNLKFSPSNVEEYGLDHIQQLKTVLFYDQFQIQARVLAKMAVCVSKFSALHTAKPC